MKLQFTYYDKDHTCLVPPKRRFVIEVLAMDEKFCRGKVIEKNEWAVPDIGHVDTFITSLFKEIKN